MQYSIDSYSPLILYIFPSRFVYFTTEVDFAWLSSGGTTAGQGRFRLVLLVRKIPGKGVAIRRGILVLKKIHGHRGALRWVTACNTKRVRHDLVTTQQQTRSL